MCVQGCKLWHHVYVTFFRSSISIAFLFRNKQAGTEIQVTKWDLMSYPHIVRRLGCGRGLLAGSCIFEGGEKVHWVGWCYGASSSPSWECSSSAPSSMVNFCRMGGTYSWFSVGICTVTRLWPLWVSRCMWLFVLSHIQPVLSITRRASRQSSPRRLVTQDMKRCDIRDTRPLLYYGTQTTPAADPLSSHNWKWKHTLIQSDQLTSSWNNGDL